MSKKFNLILNILITTLIVVLVFVMMNYYAGTSSSIPTDVDKIADNILPNNNDNTIISNDTSKTEKNETIISINESGEIKTNSGEDEKDNEIIENNNEQNIIINNTEKEEKPQNETPVIITSENETSSKEKREILTELDKTLMELLDVVEKVQTVDETRLIIEDSEVQE